MKKKDRPVRLWLEYLGFIILYATMRVLPVGVAILLARVIAAIYFLIDPKHRRRCIQHIIHARLKSDVKGARRLAWESYRHISMSAVEFVKADQLFARPGFIERFQKRYDPGVAEVLASGKGYIVTTGHFGNWELSAIAFAVIERPGCSVNRPMNNPKISALVEKSRKRFGMELIPKKGALSKAIRRLKNGTPIAFLIDQRAARTEGVHTLFFGQPAITHQTPALLHARLGVPILFLTLKRLRDGGGYELRIKGPITVSPSGNPKEDIRLLTQKVTTLLESEIASAPEQWFWFHRRWENINREKTSRSHPLA